MEWEEKKIETIFKLNYGKNLPKRNRKSGEYPVYSSAGEIDCHTEPLINSEGVIIGRKGSVGTIYFSKTPFFPIDTTFYIKPSEQYDLLFIYYCLKTINLDKLNSDAAVPGLNRNNAYNQKIKLPPLPTQQKIASILGAYDDLIENNLKRIRLLEEAAQNLYKEWFVNFKFPNHETHPIDKETGLPEGWEKRNLNNILIHKIGGGWGKKEQSDNFIMPAYVVRGTDMPNLALGNLSKIPFRFHKESNLKTRRLEADDIVFEVSGGSSKNPVGRSVLITKLILDQFDEDVICASFCKLMRVNSEIASASYISLTLDHYYKNGVISQFEKRSASNIINFNFKDFIQDVNFNIPNSDILNYFNKLTNNLFSQKSNLAARNQTLKKARDLLLPRLMNQDLDV